MEVQLVSAVVAALLPKPHLEDLGCGAKVLGRWLAASNLPSHNGNSGKDLAESLQPP